MAESGNVEPDGPANGKQYARVEIPVQVISPYTDLAVGSVPELVCTHIPYSNLSLCNRNNDCK